MTITAAAIYCVTDISCAFIISFLPVILLPTKGTCFLQNNKLAAIHPTGSVSIRWDLLLFATTIMSDIFGGSCLSDSWKLGKTMNSLILLPQECVGYPEEVVIFP